MTIDQQGGGSGSGVFASQLGHDNEISLAQSGDNNQAVLVQEGNGNEMHATQTGGDNRLVWTQDGNNLAHATVSQTGGQALQITQSN
jgi:hypothetical protein